MKKFFSNMDSATGVLMYVGFGFLLLTSIMLAYDDYWSSFYGYTMLPTTKITGSFTIYLVAALPQVLQLVGWYLWFNDKSRIGLTLAIGAAVLDWTTDSMFKIDPNVTASWFVAPLEAFFLYTVGSEFLFNFAIGNLVKQFPRFMNNAVDVMETVSDGISILMGNEGTTKNKNGYGD